MADQPGFWINAIGWIVIALLGLALWTFTRPRPWEKSKVTQKASIEEHRKQVITAKKWVVISLGCLYCLLYPDIISLLWFNFISLLLIAGFLLALIFIFPTVFDGLSIKLFDKKK